MVSLTKFVILEFNGVKTETEPHTRDVFVIIPLRMTSEDYFKHKDYLMDCFRVVHDNLRLHETFLTLINLNIIIQVEIKEREENNMYIPEVKEIIHRKSKRGELFTVKWSDNTSTPVKLAEGEQSDVYTAFLYSIGKKLFSNKGDGRKFVQEKKRIFEDRVAKISAEKAHKRRQMAILQSLESEDFEDISDEIYTEMFVAPCMVSKELFKKNKK